MRRNTSFASGQFLLLISICLAGCGVDTVSLPSPTAGPALSGTVHGGAQPISGAIIQLYAVGNNGNGSAATDILTGPQGSSPLAFATTGSDGSFAITGDYSCPANPATPVYLAATTGNPGISGTVNNTSIALVAALGPCNALLSAGASQHIKINEATTTAAAWALSPFATSITSIGATSTNLAGITQAFAIASQLVDTSLGTSPNASVAAWTSIESAKLYSLADILATCVNSNGSDGHCSTLFTAATPTGGTAPTDTFASALSVAQNPTSKVVTLFSLIPASPPFPALASPPNDWTMTITYSEALDSTGPLAGANISTIDQQGNLWGTYQYGENILKFSPALAPLVNVSLYPFDGTTEDPSIEDTGRKTGVMSIDPSGNLWFASGFADDINTFQTDNPTGAIYELDPNGNVLSGAYGYTSGGIFNPWMAMADTNGFIWVGNLGYYQIPGGAFINPGGDISLLSPTGAAESPGTGWNVAKNFQPGIINFDGYHNAWVTDTKAAQLLEFPPLTTGTGLSNAAPAIALAIPNYATDIVFDTQDQGWFAYGPIGKINTNDTILSTAITNEGGLIDAVELAVDASNRIFALNTNFNIPGGSTWPAVTLSVFSGGSGGGAPLSPIALGSDISATSSSFGDGSGFLIDNAGSVLVDGVEANSSYNATAGTLTGYPGLTRFVGLATPTKTPNTGPPQAP